MSIEDIKRGTPTIPSEGRTYYVPDGQTLATVIREKRLTLSEFWHDRLRPAACAVLPTVLSALSHAREGLKHRRETSPWNLGEVKTRMSHVNVSDGVRVDLAHYNPDDPNTIPVHPTSNPSAVSALDRATPDPNSRIGLKGASVNGSPRLAIQYGDNVPGPRIQSLKDTRAAQPKSPIGAYPLRQGITAATAFPEALDSRIADIAETAVFILMAGLENIFTRRSHTDVHTPREANAQRILPDINDIFSPTLITLKQMERKTDLRSRIKRGWENFWIRFDKSGGWGEPKRPKPIKWYNPTILDRARSILTSLNEAALPVHHVHSRADDTAYSAYNDVTAQPIQYNKPPLVARVGPDGVERRWYGFFSPSNRALNPTPPYSLGPIPRNTRAPIPGLTGLDYFGGQRPWQIPAQPAERQVTLPIALPIQPETQTTSAEAVLNLFHGLSLRDTETPSLDAQGVIPLVPNPNDPHQTSRWLYTNGSVIRMMARQQDGTMHTVSLTRGENNRIVTQVRTRTLEDRRNMGESLFNSVQAILSRNDTTPALVGPEETSKQLLAELYTLCENNIAFYEMLDIPNQRLGLLRQLKEAIQLLDPAIGKKTQQPAPRRTLVPKTLIAAAVL